jgi:hypothetical protein
MAEFAIRLFNAEFDVVTVAKLASVIVVVTVVELVV